MATFRSADFGSAVGILESKIIVLAKLDVLTTAYFCESVDFWTTSSVMSTILGLGEILGLETF